MSNNFPMNTTGRIATDLELRVAQSGRPWVRFRVAVDDNTQRDDGSWEKRQTVFHDVVAFGKAAEIYATQYRKGDPVVIVGDLRFTEYTTKTGEQRTGTEIIATTVAPDMRRCSVTIDRATRETREVATAVTTPPAWPQQPAGGVAI